MTDTSAPPPVVAKATTTPSGDGGGVFVERGVSGLRQWGGYIYEEDDPNLRGLNGIRFFRLMSRYPTCAAIRFALESLMRRSVWRIEPSGKTAAHDDAAEFMTGVLFEDMAHQWEDFIADACSMFPYGFAPFEIVYKKRSGIPKGTDPTKGSRFDDGKIGLKRIALRSQDTLSRWAFDEQNKDELVGMYQIDPVKGGEPFIPAERLVLIRTTPARTNPEGESILRGAVRPYQQVLEIEMAEGSMATRAAGVVVVDIPEGAYKDPLTRAAWEGIGRNLADNREGFVLLPTVVDKEMKAVPAYNIRYVVADGRRSGDMGPIITRKQREILMTVLADWLMLGHTAVGTQALSSDKSSIFMTALGGYLGVILAAVNREIIPAVWAANGLPWDLMPQARAEPLEKSDLGVIGSFVSALSGAGMPLFPDDELENALRALAKLPAKPEEGIPVLGAPPPNDPRRGGRQPLPPKDQARGQDQPQTGGQGREGETDSAAARRRQQDEEDDDEDPAGGKLRKAATCPALGFGRRMAAVAKAWNPFQPRDHLGQFARMAETGGGSGGRQYKPLYFGALPSDLLTAHFHGKRKFAPGGVKMRPEAVGHHLDKHPEDTKKLVAALRNGLGRPAYVGDPEPGANGLNVALYYPAPDSGGEMVVIPVSVDRDQDGFYWARSGFVAGQHEVDRRIKKGRIHPLGKRPRDKAMK